MARVMDQMAVLEKRVNELLLLVKGLRLDKSTLEKQVVTMSRKLSKNERDSVRWGQDRVRLRSKVEKILSEVGTYGGRSVRLGSLAVKPRKRGEA